MSVDIITRIKDRLVEKGGSNPFPTVSQEVIEAAEAKLGFKIPPTLKSIYLNVADGGVGPAYGIIRLNREHGSDLGTLVETYEGVQAGAKYLGTEWKVGLLPFCEWGCNVLSCVDCNDVNYRVYESRDCVAHREDYSIDEFFQMWLDGVDILKLGRSPVAIADKVNPFTGKKWSIVSWRKNAK